MNETFGEPNAQLPQPDAGVGNDDAVNWTASEFIAHQKTASWYGALGGCTVGLMAVVYLISRDFISTFVILFCALMFSFYASRQPRQLAYEVSHNGVKVGQKYFMYSHFRSFSIVPEGAFSSIIFMPLKRFSAPLTIYCAADSEDQIVSVLASHLPYQENSRDAIDRLMRRIRF